MAGTTYTITLVDQASAQARKVQMALTRVAVTAASTANAMRSGSRAEQAFARDAERLARSELRAAQAIERAGRAAHRLGGAGRQSTLGQTARGFSLLRASAGAAAVYMAKEFVMSTARAGRGLLEAHANAENFGRAMTGIGNDVQLSGKWEEELRRLRIPLVEGRESVIGLLSAMKEMRGLDAGRTVNDILRLNTALNLDTDKVARLNKVFSDIAGKGKVMREELTTQLGELKIGFNLQSFLREVAATTGKSFAEAEKMLSAPGSAGISAEIGIPALIRSIAESRGIKNLEDEAMKAARATSGTLKDFDNSVQELRETLGKALIDAGALEAIQALTGALRDLGSTIRVFRNLGGIRGVVDQVRTDVAARRPQTAGGQTVKALSGVFGSVAPMGAVGLGGAALEATRRELEQQARDAGYGMGKQLNAGGAAGIRDWVSLPEGEASVMAQGVVGASRDEFQIRSPSRKFAEQGRYAAEGLALGLDRNADLAFQSAQDLAMGTIAEAEMAPGGGSDAARLQNIGSAAGASIVDRSATSARSGVSVGAVHVAIEVNGAQGGAVEQMRDFFEFEFAALLERRLESVGA